MPRLWSFLITTSRARPVWRRISGLSPTRRRFRSSSTTCPRAPLPTSRSRRSPQIARHPKIVAIKDATGNLGRVSAQRLACGEDFCQLSGNDDMALGFNAMGGVGCISVTANVAPKLCADFQKAMREGRWDEAMKLQDRLYPLHAALFTDASPAPTKYALSRLKNRLPGRAPPPAGRGIRGIEAARWMLHWSTQALSKHHGQAAPIAVRQAEGRRREPARALRLFRRGPVRSGDPADGHRSEIASRGRGLDCRELCDDRWRGSVADQQPHPRIQPRQSPEPRAAAEAEAVAHAIGKSPGFTARSPARG